MEEDKFGCVVFVKEEDVGIVVVIGIENDVIVFVVEEVKDFGFRVVMEEDNIGFIVVGKGEEEVIVVLVLDVVDFVSVFVDDYDVFIWYF